MTAGDVQDGDGVDHDDYAEQFDGLDEKVVLVEILAELQQIRLALTADADGRTDGDSDAATEYRCTRCPGETTVPAAKREQHARSQHKTPPGAELSIFDPVDS